MSDQLTLLDIPRADFQSPLAYTGGKKKLWPLFQQYLPSDITEMVSPFIGGGAIELQCASQGIKVKAYDNFDLLVDFWQIFLEDAGKLGDYVSSIFPLGEKEGQFYVETKLSTVADKFERAALVWCINKQTWSCRMFSAKSWKKKNQVAHTKQYFRKWSEWQNKNITVNHQDCFDTINENNGTFMYLDPPYIGLEDRYGKHGEDRSFDHDR